MRRHTKAFTLIELLVVVGIIVVLIGILMPSLNKARKSAMRVAQAKDLQTISTAIEAYKTDHRDYPRVLGAPNINKWGLDGAIVLSQALFGPGHGDDMDGNTTAAIGFRTRPGGKLYGPYLSADAFKLKKINPAGNAGDPDSWSVLLDRQESPILYFPASTGNINVRMAGMVSPYADDDDLSDVASRYDLRDNGEGDAAKIPDGLGPFMRPEVIKADALKRFQLILGDANANGVIDAGDTEIDKPFVLWSAGPDGLYGPNADMAGADNALEAADAAKCDDVTNFR